MTNSSGRPDDLLVVEDNLGDLRLIKEVFSDTWPDTTLHAVSTGEQALDFLYQRDEHEHAPEPDVLLLDWNLPKIDGESVLREIKDDFSRIPVVVMSGTHAKEKSNNSDTGRADAYLTKPSNPNGYVNAIHSVY